MPVTPVDWTLSLETRPIVKWAAVPQGNTCETISPKKLMGDTTIIVSGDLDGGKVNLQGSHDNLLWVDILDNSGNVISISAVDYNAGGAAYASVADLFPFMRPNPNAGGVNQAANITLNMILI